VTQTLPGEQPIETSHLEPWSAPYFTVNEVAQVEFAACFSAPELDALLAIGVVENRLVVAGEAAMCTELLGQIAPGRNRNVSSSTSQ